MQEYSAYQGTNDRTGKTCIGRVVSVEPNGRTLRVKTIGVPGHGVDDLDLRDVPVICGMMHSEGDEDIALPRVNSIGLVVFVNSEAFWLGAIGNILNSNGVRKRSNQVAINPGDRIIKTVAGNKIIVRTGGTIEIQSTPLCHTYWIPNQNLINTVCQNYELETAGGYLKWTLDQKEKTTNLQVKAWNSLTPTNALTLDIGTVSDFNNEETSGDIAPFDAADLFIDLKHGTLNDDNSFKQRSLRLSVKNDGSLYFDIGPEKLTLKIDATTGDLTFETKGKINMKTAGDVSLDTSGSLTATVKKDITANVTGSMSATVKKDVSVTSSGKATVSAKGGATVSTDGDATLTAKGNATISGAGGVTISSDASAAIKGNAGTNVGSGAAVTNVEGMLVNLGGGGVGVARIGDMSIGVGNLGSPVVSNLIQGSPKVTAG